VGECSITGCDADFYAKEMCKRHYYRKSRLGKAEYVGGSVTVHDRYNDEGLRLCSSCRNFLELASFYRNSQMKDGLKSECKRCLRIRRHGGSDRDALAESQGGLCAICLKGKATQLDHDHRCCPGRQACPGCVRGVLCMECNTGMGKLGDTLESIQRVVDYLRSHGGKKA
jgi:hypothetical protein